jgi:hypothetical protein
MGAELAQNRAGVASAWNAAKMEYRLNIEQLGQQIRSGDLSVNQFTEAKRQYDTSIQLETNKLLLGAWESLANYSLQEGASGGAVAQLGNIVDRIKGIGTR